MHKKHGIHSRHFYVCNKWNIHWLKHLNLFNVIGSCKIILGTKCENGKIMFSGIFLIFLILVLFCIICFYFLFVVFHVFRVFFDTKQLKLSAFLRYYKIQLFGLNASLNVNILEKEIVSQVAINCAFVINSDQIWLRLRPFTDHS